jgi:hypothetical protein
MVVGVLLVLAGGLARPAQAQQEAISERTVPYEPADPDWKDCGLRKSDVDAFTSVRPKAAAKRTPTANIEVNYSGFPPEAREAYERAVSIWETHIKSDVTIRIDATYEDLNPRVLGGTRPNFVYAIDQDQDDQFEAWVVDALADALSEEDQQPGGADFSMSLNSARNDWHFGEGDAPTEMIDFTTIVLHEIAHGLGYLSLTGVSSGVGQYGFDFEDGNGLVPSIYTTFLAQEEGETRTSLTDESEYANPSEALGDALTSDDLVFDGINSITTANPNTGPVPPKVYAPSRFNIGSSISHLDESTYPAGSTNALMTPIAQAAETNRLPGPIVCGQLRDMAWPLGGGCQRYFADVFALQFAEATDAARGRVALSWRVRDDANIQEYIIERKYFDGTFEPIKRADSPPVTIDSLGLGTFAFRVRWIRPDGSQGTTFRSVQTTFRAQDVAAEEGTRGDQGRAEVSVSWDVPPGTDDFTYQIERKTGRSGSFSTVATTSQTQSTFQRQTPGRYQYRITAQDEMGNTVVGKTKADVQIDFEGPVYVLGPYPNPVRDAATFDLTAKSPQSVDVGVYSVTGERLYSRTRSLNPQSPKSLTIDTADWSSGMYFLRVTGREFVKVRRLVVVK